MPAIQTSFVPLAERVGQVEWDYALSERPELGWLQVTVEESSYIAGFDEWDPITQLGDYVWSDVRNTVEFVTYRPNLGVFVHVRYEPIIDPDAR